MEKRAFKDHVYSEVSRISKLFSNPHRLEIIDLIANGPKSVEDIATETGISIANASQHLQSLKKERLVDTHRKGTRIFYRLVSDQVYMTAKSLRDLALSISPYVQMTINEFKKESGYIDSYSLDPLMNSEDLVFIDVRPEDEFESGHIPNALSIPIKDLELKINDIPKDKLIIAYCRGMFCTYADEVVQLLNQKGYKAMKLDQSVFEYQNNG